MKTQKIQPAQNAAMKKMNMTSAATRAKGK